MESRLDLSGVRCPQSTFKLKRHFKTLEKGTTLRVLSDDNEALVDFPAAVAALKGSVVSVSSEKGKPHEFVFVKN